MSDSIQPIDCDVCGTRIANCVDSDNNPCEIHYNNCETPDSLSVFCTNTPNDCPISDVEEVASVEELSSLVSASGLTIQDNVNCGCDPKKDC